MANLSDGPVQELLTKPNHGVISTINEDGSIHNTVVWVGVEDGGVTVNSAEGRKWPRNIERNPTVNVLVYDEGNPYEYVEVSGKAELVATGAEGADEHINALAKQYIGQDEYPFRQPGEVRIKFLVKPNTVRHQKQG